MMPRFDARGLQSDLRHGAQQKGLRTLFKSVSMMCIWYLLLLPPLLLQAYGTICFILRHLTYCELVSVLYSQVWVYASTAGEGG